MKPMELLIWTENYWIGGCDRFLVDLVEGLREAPVRVTLAGNPHPEFDRWLARRIPWVLPRTVIPVANLVRTPLHRLDRWRPAATPSPEAAVPVGDPPPWRVAIAATRYGQAYVNLIRLRRLFASRRPEILLVNNGGYPGGESCRMASLAARSARIGRVVHFVHNMASPPAWPASVETRVDRRIDAAVDRWVTAAHRASDELSARRGIPRNRIATVHYGIEEAPGSPRSDRHLRLELGFSEDRPGLLAVANLEPRKGLTVLLRALARLRDQGVELPAAVVGEGPLREQLEDEARRLGLDDRVRFLGWRDDVEAIMDEADMIALPSVASECLPYVILEAMSRHLPVVSTDVGGIAEMVVDGVTGRVVQPGDPGELAAALAGLYMNRERATEMGERGYRRVRGSFGRDTMITTMSQVLGLP